MIDITKKASPEGQNVNELLDAVYRADDAIRRAQAEKESAEYALVKQLVRERQTDLLKPHYSRLRRR